MRPNRGAQHLEWTVARLKAVHAGLSGLLRDVTVVEHPRRTTAGKQFDFAPHNLEVIRRTLDPNLQVREVDRLRW